jgi:hypothetical protein
LRHAKGQTASIDVIISVSAILFFISMVIIFFPDRNEARQRWDGKVFDSIQALNEKRQDIAFLDGYRINEDRLHNLTLLGATAAEIYMLAGSEFDAATSDTCLFFADLSGNIQIEGLDSFGRVKDGTGGTMNCPAADPCKAYKKTTVFTKPVMRQNRITNMHLVVCK